MNIKYLAFVLITFIFSNYAYSKDTKSGMSLLAQCEKAIKVEKDETKSHYDYIEASACMSYIEGTIEGLDTFFEILKYKNFSLNRPFCFPKKFTWGQGIMIVVKYLKEHPKDLHLDKRYLVNIAFMNAFPCPK